MSNGRLCFLSFIVFVLSHPISAQHQDSVNRAKLKRLVLVESGVYAASIIGLSYIWYDSDNRQSFHFYNDNKQWLQIDKMGHAYTAYHVSSLNAKLFQNAGLSKEKAYLWAGISSSTMMLTIEVFDGLSPDYGASWGDVLANSLGAFLPYQELLCGKAYIHPKYSFSPSPFAEIRPNVLGENYSEQWLKDYNGQTYWLSTNLNIFSKNNIFPDFLAFSLGYGGDRMVYGNPDENEMNGYDSYRQYYLSMDIDFSSFNTDNKWLKALYYALNLIKIPLPTLEYNKFGWKFHPIYF